MTIRPPKEVSNTGGSSFSAMAGIVGAGGLGLLMDERIGWRDYRGLGMVLLALFVVVVVIEQLSQYLRKKLS